MKIYVAHAISGRSGEEILSWYKEAVNTLSAMGFEVFYPMVGKGYFRNEKKFAAEGYTHAPLSTNHAIFERDKWMVSQADVVYVDLMGTEAVSIGCTMELAWASLLGKHTIVALPPENIHRHAFILEAADIVFPDAESAMAYLKILATHSFGEPT